MSGRNHGAAWGRAALMRRVVLVLLILVTTFIAGSYMTAALPHRGGTPLEMAIVVIFGGLFAWVSIGFWEAMMGFFILLRGYDHFLVTRAKEMEEPTLEGSDARVAILVPICNEEVKRVFAGIRTTYQSLKDTGQLGHFDFFALSDSNDPDTWVEEEVAWAELCRSLGAYERIFYRHRRVNLKRKSGNIADFCRRWGRNYRYMIVLDADSVVAGTTLVRMVQAMERHPKAGIIQTAPTAVNRESLIARAQQFGNHLYGPMFAAGLHFIQLGDSHFWGHNAIIRVAPFMEHCGLPQLPGKPPHGGDILSHDFVEAALMRRGGWEVWLAYNLGGSYEEIPSNLLEELKRDRRWCQGNLQHIQLLFTKGLFTAHRALFLHGAMSYGSALFWFTFLMLSTAEAIVEAFRQPVYFPAGRALFPSWPVWHFHWALTLLGTTAVILFLPKFLSCFLVLFKRGRKRLFGGFFRVFLSMLAEVLLSALLAPVRMIFHSKFVFITLLGRQVGWSTQRRNDLGTGWLDALRFHGPGTFFALIWGLALFVFNRPFFWWNSPVIIPLLLSIPFSVLSSRAGLGRAFRKMGLFLIPEEVEPPQELVTLSSLMERKDHSPAHAGAEGEGFTRAVVDPQVNTLHRLMIPKERKVTLSIARRRRLIQEKALARGPRNLTSREKRELLSDPASMAHLHQRIWEDPDPGLSERWGLNYSR